MKPWQFGFFWDVSKGVYAQNIDQFRSYSLDSSIAELVYNKGVSVSEVDLDEQASSSSASSSSASSSSSSSGGFSISIYLKSNSEVFADTYLFPDELDFHLYDERIGDNEAPGIFSVEKVPGQNRVLVSLPSHIPDGVSEFSF